MIYENFLGDDRFGKFFFGKCAIRQIEFLRSDFKINNLIINKLIIKFNITWVKELIF